LGFAFRQEIIPDDVKKVYRVNVYCFFATSIHNIKYSIETKKYNRYRLMNHKSILLAALVFACTIISSCKKDVNNNDTTNNYFKINIYTAGYINEFRPVAAYWKNDKLTELSLGQATGIAINGSDIYVVGYSTAVNGAAVATYWKNGVRIPLTDSTISSKASGIAISGNDIYISGTINPSSGSSLAVYWKNGNLNVLGGVYTDIITSTANAISIQNSDVYVAGSMSDVNGNLNAVYWKNRVPVPLTAGGSNHFAQLSGLTINGNDVYAAGLIAATLPANNTSAAVSTYWKNGVPTSFADTVSSTIANAVQLKGNDVYVVGSKIISGSKMLAGYWKNGSFTSLGNGLGTSEAYAFAMQDNDIYIGGRNSNTAYGFAGYWKNGNFVQLAAESSGVLAIAVVKE